MGERKIEEIKKIITLDDGNKIQQSVFWETLDNGEKVEVGRIETDYSDEPIVPEPTQLDRIEEKISQNYEQAQQSAVDAYTMELMEGGIL